MADRNAVAQDALIGASLRLPGRWLWPSRITWLTLVILTLIVFGASLPVYRTQLQTVCRAASCQPWQTLPTAAQAIHQLGFSLHDWTLIQVVVTGLLEMAWLAVGVVIFWYKSDERVALVMALYLATFTVNLNNNLDALAANSPGWRLPVSFVNYIAGVLPLLAFYLFPALSRWAVCAAMDTLADAGILRTVRPSQFLPRLSVCREHPSRRAASCALGCAGMSVVGAQIHRYRYRSTPTQRRQTKWVVFGVSIALLGAVGVSLALPDVMTGPRTALDLLGGVASCSLLLTYPLLDRHCALALPSVGH